MAKKSNSNRNYFPHEYTAKDDPKCERLIFEMGMEGYGIFWALLETLRAQPNYTYPLENIPLAAYKYRADQEKMRHVVFDFGLFVVVDDNIFFSKGLIRRMQPMDEERKSKSEGGKKGMKTRWGNNSVNNTLNNNKNRIDKNRTDTKKLSNESKESADKPRTVASKCPAFVAPSLETLQSYFPTIGGTTQDAEAFFDHFEANGWKVSGKTPMKNWQAAARNWVRRKSEFSNTTAKTTTHETTRKYNDL